MRFRDELLLHWGRLSIHYSAKVFSSLPLSALSCIIPSSAFASFFLLLITISKRAPVP